MRRFLRILLAFALSSSASGLSVGEAADFETEDDAQDTLVSAERKRVSQRGDDEAAIAGVGPADVVVVPADDDRVWPLAWDQPPDGRLVVEHGENEVSVLRDLNVTTSTLTRSISMRLLEAALDECRDHGALKVVIDVPLDHPQVEDMCRRCRFNYSRTRRRADRIVHECYVDLYTAEVADDDLTAGPHARNS